MAALERGHLEPGRWATVTPRVSGTCLRPVFPRRRRRRRASVSRRHRQPLRPGRRQRLRSLAASRPLPRRSQGRPHLRPQPRRVARSTRPCPLRSARRLRQRPSSGESPPPPSRLALRGLQLPRLRHPVRTRACWPRRSSVEGWPAWRSCGWLPVGGPVDEPTVRCRRPRRRARSRPASRAAAVPASRVALGPRAWLVWSIAAVTVALVSSNPVYRGLVALVALNVLLTWAPRGRRLRPLGWAVVLAAAFAALINLLASHTGANVIARLPDWLPLVGGPLTRRVGGLRRGTRARPRCGAAGRRTSLARPRAARRRRCHAGVRWSGPA